jgi:hypothetical protein
MKINQDVKSLLQERLVHENKILLAKKKLRKKLSSAYNRYVDVDREISAAHYRISILAGLLGAQAIAEIVKTNPKACLGETLEEFPSLTALREKLRLWRAVREYVRVAGESRIGDIQEFLEWIGIPDFSRQALESALQNHQDSFEITKKGHERYVALK